MIPCPYTHTRFIILSNKGRLPASGLGRAPRAACTLAGISALSASLFSHTHFLSLSLSIPHSHSLPRVVLHSHPSSAPPIPFSQSLPHFDYQEQKLCLYDPSAIVSFAARRLPTCHAISSSSASFSPSASTSCASRRCLHPIVASAYDCRLCPDHQHQTRRF